jgi:hypothetical protein
MSAISIIVSLLCLIANDSASAACGFLRVRLLVQKDAFVLLTWYDFISVSLGNDSPPGHSLANRGRGDAKPPVHGRYALAHLPHGPITQQTARLNLRSEFARLPDLLDVHYQQLGNTRRHVVQIDSARFQGVLPFVSLAASGKGVNIRVVQELMGHADVKATGIYTHVMAKDISVVSSPLDRLIENAS